MIGSKKKVVDAFKEEIFAALWGHSFDFSENLKRGHFVLQISPLERVYKENEEHYDKANEKFFKIVISDF